MGIAEVLQIGKGQILQTTDIINGITNASGEKMLISSGSKNFDKILNGGFNKSSIYLIFGQNRTGKTQLCHQICIQAFKRFSEKSENFKVLYLDSENTFRPERIIQLCKAQKLDPNAVLKSIRVSRIISNNAYLKVLNNLEEEFKNSSLNLIIIDSINNHYRSEQGDPNINFKKTKNDFLTILKRIDMLTKQFNLFTIATAQVSPNFLENAIVKELPVGNIFLNHIFSEFLYLSFKEADKRFVHLINSHKLPEKKVLYKITSEGIEDYKI